MRTKQQRYMAAFEIQAEIIAYRAKAARKLAKAEKLESEAQEKVMEANLPENEYQAAFIIDQANELREQAKKLRRSHFLIEDEYIPQLVRTLGAFKTQTMPFMDDRGITLQK